MRGFGSTPNWKASHANNTLQNPPAADLDYYITAPGEKYPLEYANGDAAAAGKLGMVRQTYPDAIVETTDAFFARQPRDLGPISAQPGHGAFLQ